MDVAALDALLESDADVQQYWDGLISWLRAHAKDDSKSFFNNLVEYNDEVMTIMGVKASDENDDDLIHALDSDDALEIAMINFLSQNGCGVIK